MRTHNLSTTFAVHQRGAGASAVAHAAYIDGARYAETRTGQAWRYDLEAERVTETTTLLSPGAPADWADPERLFNAVEQHEEQWADRYYAKTPHRAEHHKQNARTDIRGHLTVANEIGTEAAWTIARAWAQEQFVRHGLVVHLSLHADTDNLHFHFQGTARRINHDGSFGGYAAFISRKAAWTAWMKEGRALASHLQNAELQRRGIGVHVEHRSHAALGLSLAPTQHEGPIGHAIEQRGARSHVIERNAAVAAGNRDGLDRDAWQIAVRLSAVQATWTERDLDRALDKIAGGDADIVARAKATIFADQRLVAVGEDARGRRRLTTKDYLDAETALWRSAGTLAGRRDHRGDPQRLDQQVDRRQHIQGFAFSDQQRAAMRQTVAGQDLTIVVGRAGAGKTTLLREIRVELEASGQRVRGAAIAGIAADALRREAGIDSRTIASLLETQRRREALAGAAARGDKRALAYLDKTRDAALRPDDVLVVDEAGMIDTRAMAELLGRADRAGARVVLVGDPDQLAAIQAGAALRGLIERHGAATLDEIFRQQDPAMRRASELLAQGDIAGGLAFYHGSGRVQFAADRASAQAQLTRDVAADRAAHPDKTRIVLAYRNADVQALNHSIRQARIDAGEIDAGTTITTERGTRNIAVGDRIVFLRNDRQLGVYNGTLGTVEDVGQADPSRLGVRLDGESGQPGRRIAIDTRDYRDFDHAYAVTIHKSQGQTIDRVFVLGDELMQRDAAYVALTRHREEVALYADRATFCDVDELARSFAREPGKDLAADYGTEDPGRERVRTYVEARTAAAQLMSGISGRTGAEGRFADDPAWADYQAAAAMRNGAAREIAADWSAHRLHARAAGVTRDAVEVHAGRRKRPMTDAEIAAAAKVAIYREIADEARDLWNRIKRAASIRAVREHPAYEQFDRLRGERNRIAVELRGNPQLYRRPLAEAKISPRMVRSQAEAQPMSPELVPMARRSQEAAPIKTGKIRDAPTATVRLTAPKTDPAMLVSAFSQATAAMRAGISRGSGTDTMRKHVLDLAAQIASDPKATAQAEEADLMRDVLQALAAAQRRIQAPRLGLRLRLEMPRDS